MLMTTRRVITFLAAPFVVVLVILLVLTSFLPFAILQIERGTYRVGETVRFVLRNGMSEPALLNCPAPWEILRDVGGLWKRVEEHVCAGVLVVLEPGESRGWAWNAKTQPDRPDLAPVGPGHYRIEILVRTDCMPSGGTCGLERRTAYFSIE